MNRNHHLMDVPTHQDAVKFGKDFGAGAAAAVIAKTVIAPIERVKLILQVSRRHNHLSCESPLTSRVFQLQTSQSSISVDKRYKGMVDCFLRLETGESLFATLQNRESSGYLANKAFYPFGEGTCPMYLELEARFLPNSRICFTLALSHSGIVGDGLQRVVQNLVPEGSRRRASVRSLCGRQPSSGGSGRVLNLFLYLPVGFHKDTSCGRHGKG